MRTMYHSVPLHSNVTSPSPISQNFPLSTQSVDNKTQARVDQTHSRYSLSARITEVFSYFWKAKYQILKWALKWRMSSTSSDKIRWTKPLVFWNIQINTGEWSGILSLSFFQCSWREMLSSGHTTQFSQPQVNPTRCWGSENPTRPPTLSMLRGQRMEQHFTWDKPFTTEISHTITLLYSCHVFLYNAIFLLTI